MQSCNWCFNFRAHRNYLDGAFWSNNPVLDVLTEIEERNMVLEQAGRGEEKFIPTCVVSIGCTKEEIKKVSEILVLRCKMSLRQFKKLRKQNFPDIIVNYK